MADKTQTSEALLVHEDGCNHATLGGTSDAVQSFVAAIIDDHDHSWVNSLRPVTRPRNLAAVTRLVVACTPASAFFLQVRFFRHHMNVRLFSSVLPWSDMSFLCNTGAYHNRPHAFRKRL